jgi:DNA-binding GntR family transcriptional regulator
MSASVGTDVTGAIREAVLRGDYVPHHRLVDADLCERFGASRSHLRSAFQQLAVEGLVEIQRNRGARPT